MECGLCVLGTYLAAEYRKVIIIGYKLCGCGSTEADIKNICEYVKSEKNKEIAKFIYSTRDGIPNLKLNEDKTEHFFYDNGILKKIKGKK